MGLGCMSAKSRPDQEPPLSQRSVQLETQNPLHHHGINSTACGYGFAFDGNELVEVLAKQQQHKIRELQNDLYQEFEQLYIKARKFYKDHDIDACIPLINSLKQIALKLNYEYLDVNKQEKRAAEEFMAEVEQKYAEMLKFVSFMQLEGWEDKGISDGIHMHAKRGTNTVGMLMQKDIDIPVEIFLIVLAEMDFYDQLIPTITNSKEEKYVDRNHKLGYCVFDFPILSQREAFFEGIGFNRLNHNDTIFMYCQSINDRPEYCSKLDYKPIPNPKFVQINFEYLLIRYIPTGINKGKATLALNIDMKLNFVPLGIMEMVCKKFCFDFFKVVMQASENFKGSKWEAKVKRHPEAFQFFKQTAQNYYEKRNFR